MSKARDEYYKFYTQHKIDHLILFAYINELEKEKESSQNEIMDLNLKIIGLEEYIKEREGR